LLTDGSRIYFGEKRGAVPILAEVSAAGGDTAVINTPFPFGGLCDISPDHSSLLVSANASLSLMEAQLWILPVPAGAPRQVGNLVATDAAWSPDSLHIAYSQGNDLYIADTSGKNSRKLATLAGSVEMVTWSPGGKKLRFNLDDRGTRAASLWEISVDGGDLHPLLPGWNNPPSERQGKWTQDGRHFVFSSIRNDKRNLWVLRENPLFWTGTNSRPVQLTFGPMEFRSAIPSLDGKKLFAIGSQRRGELARFDVKTRQFVPYLPGIPANALDFSRDGQWVTYATYPDATLWRSRVDGSEKLQLSFPPLEAFVPRWSPDGKWVVYEGRSEGKLWETYLVSRDGGNSRSLLPPDRTTAAPGWSPDGNTVMFSGLPWANASPEKASSVQLLNLKTNQETFLPGSEGFWDPNWSPDGRYVVALTADSNRLMIYDFNSQKWVVLASIQNATSLTWSKDSRYIYFDTLYVEEPAIYRIGLLDRKLEWLASLKDFRITSLFASRMNLTPEGSPVLLRDTGIEEIYALDLTTQ
jgi:Tol biopolymer transport system component